MISLIRTLALLLPLIGAAQPSFVDLVQSDSVVGKVKSVKEVVIYLDSTIQQPRLFESDGDYGHSGFMNPTTAQKSMKISWYDYPYTRFASYIKNYDSIRNLTSEIWYHKDGTEYTRYVYAYDKKSNLVEEKDISPYDQSYYVKKHFYNYNNNKTSSIHYSSSDPSFYGYRNYIYDEKNRMIKSKRFDEYGLASGEQFKFNDDGQLAEEIGYTSYKEIALENGVTSSIRDTVLHVYRRTKYEYNDKRNSVRTISHYKESISESETIRDQQGRIIKIISPDVSAATLINTYNSNGRLEKKTYSYPDSDTISVRSWQYEYDKRGNLKRVRFNINEKQQISEFRYKFDSTGNWIWQSKSVDGVVLYERVREISYY